MKSDFMMALNQLSAERGLAKDQVLSAIEVALASAFRRDDPAGGQNLSVKLNPNTGDISIFALRTVVDEVESPETEISLAEARATRPNIQVGEEIAESEEVPHDASRIAAQTARQVIMQRLREAEREKIFEEYSAYQGELISGNIESVEKGPTVFVNLNPHQAQNQNRARGIMRPDHQVGNERYRKGQNLKVLLVEVQQTPRGPEVVVSRSHRDLLRRLMESEVPEIGNGTVEIRAIARDPGVRSKVAVASHQEGVDPVGSCIGLRGNRIQSIVNELQGEKIDVIEWDSNPRVLITRALSPADVGAVELDQHENTAYVVVPENQMSLAIGRDGQNARLAARLSGWRLDIKNVEQWNTLRTARAAEAARAEAARLAEAEVVAALEARRAAEAAEMAGAMPVAEAAAAAIAETGLVTEATGAGEVVEVVAQVEAAIEAAVPALVEELAPPETIVPEPVATESAVVEAVAAPVEAEPEIDEDALLDALIAAEESAAVEPAIAAANQPAGVGLSVDALGDLTIEDVIDDESAEFDDEEEEEELPRRHGRPAGRVA